ncbi:hemagglutinin repeat-containing protein [Pseudoxanthomonas composti]
MAPVPAGPRRYVAELCKRALALLLSCTVPWASFPAWAQVALASNAQGQTPGQQVAANGVPVVDIVAPNAKGVSHNRYNQFDVGTQGLILNNSAQISRTELGGYVAGNDNLKGAGPASLILNEVSSTRSRLDGYVEIAGSRAQLVIANPNGISCNGCGFLNTSRVTLATGRPHLGADGALNGFDVGGGTLEVGARGLDASGVDRLDLLSRQLGVAGSVWAQDLNGVSGGGRFSYDGLLLEALPATEGGAPAFGIDVAQLGGMYANRIRLIATEAGVGVVSKGTLAAQAGDLRIDSSGQVSLDGATVARDALAVAAAGALLQDGTAGSQTGDVSLRGASMALRGDTIAAGTLDAATTGALLQTGRSSAGALRLAAAELAVDGNIYSAGTLALNADGLLRSAGTLHAGGNASLQAEELSLSGMLQSGASLALDAGRMGLSGTLDAADTLDIRSTGSASLAGLAQGRGGVQLLASALDNRGSLISGGALRLQTARLDNRADGMVSANGALSVDSASTDNAGTLYARAGLDLRGERLDNAGQVYSAGAATLALRDALDNRGSLVAADALRVDTAQLASSGDLGSQRGALALRVNTLALGGNTVAGGAASIQAQQQARLEGSLSAATLAARSGGDLVLGGSVRSTAGGMDLQAVGALDSSAVVSAAGDLRVQADAALRQRGQLQSLGALVLQGASVDSDGVLDAGGSLQATAVDALTLAGTVQAREALALQAGGALDSAAQVVAGGPLSASAAAMRQARDATLSAGEGLQLQVLGALENAGQIHALGGVDLRAHALRQDGRITSAGNMDVQVQETLENTGSLVAHDALAVRAGTMRTSGQIGSEAGDAALTADGDLALAGSAAAAGALRAVAAGDLHQAGALSGGSVSLSAGRDLVARGTLQSAGTLDLRAHAALSFAAQARSEANASLQADQLHLEAGSVLQSGAAIAADARVLDSQGSLDANGDLRLFGSDALTLGGIVQAGGDVALRSDGQLSAAGQVIAGRDLRIDADGLDNAVSAVLAAQRTLEANLAGSLANAGTLQAGQDLRLQVLQTLDNTGEAIAVGDVEVDAGTLRSRGRLGSEAGAVRLSAREDLDLAGVVAAAGALHAQAGGSLYQAGGLSAQSLVLSAGRDAVFGGSLHAIQAADLQAQRTLQLDGQLGAASVRLGAGATLATGQAAQIQTAQSLALDAGAIDSRGTLEAGTTLDLQADGDIALAGALQAGTTIDIAAGSALHNAAQLHAGSDLSVNAASLDNRGMLAAQRDLSVQLAGQAGNAGGLLAGRMLALDVGSLSQQGQAYGAQGLELSARGSVDNQGDLIGGQALQVTAAGLASSGRLGSESGEVALRSHGDLRLAGTLAASGAFTAQADGALSQSGTLSAASLLRLDAGGDLTIDGALDAQQVDLGSGATLRQRGSVRGQAVALEAAHLDNAGQTVSAGDLSLHAGDIAIAGTVGAGIAANGELGSGGTLSLIADRTMQASGTLLAGHALQASGQQLQLAGSTTRVSGNATLSATGAIDHRNANLLAGGTLAMSAGGTLDNAGGSLQANQLTLNSAALDNAGGRLVQSGGGDTRLVFDGGIDNSAGTIASNGGNLTLAAASLDNSQGRIEHAGAGTLDISSRGALGNAGGRVLTQGRLTLSASGALDNQNGVIAAAGDAGLAATSLSNVAGSIAARDLAVTTSGAIDNRNGLLQASGGALTLRADSLTNAGGTAQAVASNGSGGGLWVELAQGLDNGNGSLGASGEATLIATNIANAGGSVQAGGALNITARGQFDNHQGGRFGAGGAFNLTVNGALRNGGGQLDAGTTLTASAGSIDNAQGHIVNNGTGLTRLVTGGGLVNASGNLGGRGSVVIDAASIGNSNGQLVAGGDLTANTNALDNQGGNVYAGGSFALQRGGATVDNRNGTLKAEQAVRLDLQSLSNAGGRIGAGSSTGGAGDVVISTSSFDGGGSILAQNLLDLTLHGDYVHRAGADLSSNGDFFLRVGGNLTNEATLKAARVLDISAGNIFNRGGASILANETRLGTGGTLDNAGSVSGNTALSLRAGTINNTGNLVGGNVLVEAGTLINGADLGGATDNSAYGSALLGSTGNMTLLVRDQLLNRDARIFSLGNIAIGAARDGGGTLTARTGVLNNISGSIEADGSVLIAANQINNRRRVVNAQTAPLSEAEREAINATTPPEVLYVGGPMPEQNGPNVGDRIILEETRTYDVISRDQLISASAEGRLAAGNNISLSGSVDNNASTIAAAGVLSLNRAGTNGLSDALISGQEVVSNNALALSQRTRYADVAQVAVLEDGDCARGYRADGCTYSVQVEEYNSGILDNSYIALAANMTGGQGVAINGANISNGAVSLDGRAISGAQLAGSGGIGAPSQRGVERANGASGQSVQGRANAASGPARVDNGLQSAGPVATSVGAATGVSSSTVAPAAVEGQTQTVLLDGTVNVPDYVRMTAPGGLYRLASIDGATTAALGRAAGALGGINAYRGGGPVRRYLIETDPRFVNYDNFISSDYLLDKLGVDPEADMKRLGDGFYEQRLVLDQITDLTGRRYLGNYEDGVAQYRALLESGVAASNALQLSVGVGLSAAQVAALTEDIVWMVEHEYAGQKVLVPVVYLASSSLQLRSDGALIAGGTVDLNATGTLTNQGAITGTDVLATAGSLLNQGRIAGSDAVVLQARDDLLNLGGQIQGQDVALSAGNALRSEALAGIGAHSTLGAISAGNSLALLAGGDLSLSGTKVAAGGNALLAAGGSLLAQPGALREDAGLIRGGEATSIQAGGNLQLQAGNDLQLRGVAVEAGGSAALMAGGTLSLSQDGSGTRTRVSAAEDLQLSSGKDLLLRQVEVSAGGDLVATAARDLTVESVLEPGSTVVDRSRQGKTQVTTTTTRQSLDVQALNAGGNLVLAAGNDVNLVAAQLQAGQGMTVVAGNDLNVTALTTTDTSSTTETRKRFKQVTQTSDQTVHGTSFQAGSDIVLQAGHDATLTAATVSSTNGGIALSAGNDVNLLSAQEQHDAVQDMAKKKKGTFSSKTTTTHDEWHDSVAVASTLSGESVTVAAGNDLLSQGAQIVGTGDVLLAAGNDLKLETAQNTHSEEHDRTVKKSGLYGGGGFSVNLGVTKKTDTLDATEVSHSGSVVGSTDGLVTLTAGNAVNITGSDVLSAGGTTIVGKEVTIAAAENRIDTVQTSKQQSAGITLGLTGGVVDAAQAAYGAVKRGSEVEDDRLKALYAARAAYAAGDAAGLFNNGMAGYQGQAVAGNVAQDGTSALADGNQGAANAAGVSLRLGIGASSSSSKTVTHEESTGGSRILSDGDVTIAATGGDLSVIGSQIAGQNVALAAARNLSLLSNQESNTSKSENKNAGGEIGVSVGATTGYYLSVSAGKGQAKGNSDLHAESVVSAADTLTLVSGNDTTIQGAQALGNRVVADIGGNLLIKSEQDNSEYKSKQQQASLTLATGSGSGGSYSQQKVESSYTSVAEQSGIQAGAGGFDINVGGNTHLVGAAIASSADAALNHLSTGSLTVEDLQNEAKAKTSSVGVSASTGGGMAASAAAAGLSALGGSKDSASSTTTSDIAAGTVVVRNGDTTALDGLTRTATTLDGNGVKEINLDKLQERAELGQVAGQVWFRAAGDLAAQMQQRALEDFATAQANGDAAAEADALARLNSWSESGTNKTLLHGLTGAAVAALGGSDALAGAAGAMVAEAAKQAMADYLVAQGMSPQDPAFGSLMELGSAALGTALGGGTGAGTALAGDQYNRQLHPDEVTWINQNAESFAQQQGISVDEAKYRLTLEAAAQVDAVLAKQVGIEKIDTEALAFLNTNENSYSWGQAFRATDAEYGSFPQYGNLLANTTKQFQQVYNVLGASGVTKNSLQQMYQGELLTWASAIRGSDGIAVLETFSGDVGMAAGVVRKVVQGDTQGASTDVALAALPTVVGKTVGVLRPLAKAAEDTIWLNGRVVSDTWVNARNELTWVNPLTGAKEVVPSTAKVHVDHILPQDAIKKIDGFDELPVTVQKELLNDPANLQPVIASANCSKGCKVEGVGDGWMTWNGKPVSAEYKNYLEGVQDKFRGKVEEAVKAYRESN